MPQPANGLYDVRDDSYFLSLECDNKCYTTLPNYPRDEYEMISIEKMWSMIAAHDLVNGNMMRVYINHSISDINQALPIKPSWNGGSRIYSNKYVEGEPGELFMDGGVAVLTGSKAGLKRRVEVENMIRTYLIACKV